MPRSYLDPPPPPWTSRLLDGLLWTVLAGGLVVAGAGGLVGLGAAVALRVHPAQGRD